MKELISLSVLLASLYGGTLAAEKIYVTVRTAALTKAAQGLPSLSSFGHALTSHPHGSSAKSANGKEAKGTK